MIPPKLTHKRFIIYTRCSTDDQSQGDYTTLDAQVHHCKSFLARHGYEVAQIVEDDGYSGKDLNRPGIQTVLREIGFKDKERTFDGIVFLRLDRLSRHLPDTWHLIDLCRQNGIKLLSVQEQIESATSHGRFMTNMLANIGAFEREQIGERVRAAGLARVREGRRVGGVVPYGYKLIPDGDPRRDGTQPRKAVINESLAPKLHLVWQMAAENKSTRTIARELAAQGIKGPTGKEWRVQTILNILKNPFYRGDVKWGGEIHQGKHEAIVDRTLWEKANRIVSAKLPGHKFFPKPKTYTYLLEGLLVCGECGSMIISKYCKGRNGRPFHYYICGRKNQGLGCDAQPNSALAFDKALIDYFQRSSQDQRLIMEAIEKAIEDARSKLTSTNDDIETIERKIESLRAEVSKMLDLALEGTISKGPTYKEKMEKLEDEIASLEMKLDKLQTQRKMAAMAVNSCEFIHSNIVFLMAKLDKASPESQKMLLQALIGEIVVHKDSIVIHMALENPTQETIVKNAIENLNGNPPKENRPIDKSTNEAVITNALGSPERQEMLPTPH